MERLTDIINGWTFEETIKTAESLMEAEKNMFKWDVLRHLKDFAENYRERIKEYQQLEEQGRLVKLPCKVGDDVYYILGIPNKTPCAIDKCTFELSDINKIGKTLFLTREAAEAKLAESLRKEADGERYGDITLD